MRAAFCIFFSSIAVSQGIWVFGVAEEKGEAGSDWSLSVHPDGSGAASSSGPVLVNPRSVTIGIPVPPMTPDTPMSYPLSGTPLSFQSQDGGAVLSFGTKPGDTPTIILTTCVEIRAELPLALPLLLPITGPGGIVKTGPGFLYLLGPNSFSGGTVIKEGIVTVQGNAALGTGPVVMAPETTLQFVRGAALDNPIFLDPSSQISVPIPASVTLNGLISGGPLIKQGATSTLVLTHPNNDYVGETIVTAGTLALAGEGSLPPESVLIIDAPDASFSIADLATEQTSIGGLAGVGHVCLGDKALVVCETGSDVFSGEISGQEGSLIKEGPGTLTLVGQNTYAGGTDIREGTLALAGAGTLAPLGPVEIDSAILDVRYAETGITIGTLSGNASSVIALGDKPLAICQEESALFAGAITDCGGGSLIKEGAGTLTLAGVNTFSGITEIDEGALHLAGTGSLASPIHIQGEGCVFDISATTAGAFIGGLAGVPSSVVELGSQSLVIRQEEPTTFAGVITDCGGGSLLKQGPGTLTLTAPSTYTGGTVIDGGGLCLRGSGALHPSGAVYIRDALFDISSARAEVAIGDLSGDAFSTLCLGDLPLIINQAGSSTFSGSISGELGSLIKQDSGTLVLAGVNSYGGGTVVAGGTLAGTTESLQGVITNYATLVLDQAFDGACTAHISGEGCVVKTGPGKVELEGINSYSGGTVIAEGTLQGSTVSLQGPIKNEATVVFDQDFDGICAANISGAGNVMKTGHGRVNFTGNSFMKNFAALQGKTSLNGAFTVESAVIHPDAALSGAGTLRGNLAVAGLLAPGNSMGALTIEGDATFDSSSVIELGFGQSSSDLLVVTGNLTLNSPTLQLIPSPGVYAFPSSFTFVDATAVSGSFGTVVSTLPLASPSIVYNYSGDSPFLEFFVQRLPFSTLVSEGNAGKVAECLDAMAASPCQDLNDVMDVIASMTSPSDIRDALRQMQPSQMTSLAAAEENALFYFRDATLQQITTRRQNCPSKGIDLWLTGIAGAAEQESGEEEPGYKEYSAGGLLGVDSSLGTQGLFGGSVGYLYTHLTWEHARGHARVQNLYANLYGNYGIGTGFYLDAFASGGYTLYDTERRILFGFSDAVNTAATSTFGGWQATAHLGTGYTFRYKTFKNTFLDLTPLLNVDYFFIYQEKWQEHSADSLNLHVHSHTADLLAPEAGLDLRLRIETKRTCTVLFARGTALYEARLHGEGETARFACDCTMHVTGLYPSRLLGTAAAGLDICFGKNALTFSYQGRYGKDFEDNALFFKYARRF